MFSYFTRIFCSTFAFQLLVLKSFNFRKELNSQNLLSKYIVKWPKNYANENEKIQNLALYILYALYVGY